MAINTLFQNIADAIRERGGTSAALTPAQMPAAIAAIPAGGVEILKGTDSPSSQLGENGQLYLKYASTAYESLTSGLYAPENLVSDTAQEVLAIINGRYYYKTDANPAIVAIGITTAGYHQPVLASPIADAVKYSQNYDGTIISYDKTYVIDGVQWYFNSGGYGYGGSPSITSNYPVYAIDFSTQEGAKTFLSLMRVSSAEYPINDIMAKINGTWVNAIGADPFSINTGGGS